MMGLRMDDVSQSDTSASSTIVPPFHSESTTMDDVDDMDDMDDLFPLLVSDTLRCAPAQRSGWSSDHARPTRSPVEAPTKHRELLVSQHSASRAAKRPGSRFASYQSPRRKAGLRLRSDRWPRTFTGRSRRLVSRTGPRHLGTATFKIMGRSPHDSPHGFYRTLILATGERVTGPRKALSLANMVT